MTNAIEPTLEYLREAVELSCKPSNVPRIIDGRELVLAMPRHWVLAHIESIALDCIDFSDDWEYRRLLELLDKLDGTMMRRFASMGISSPDFGVREAAADFLE